MATIVEERYALALYGVAREENKIKEMLEQLTVVASIARQTPEFIKMLQTPSIPLQDKMNVIKTTFEGKVDQYLLNFLMIITEKRRATGIQGMQDAFKHLYYEEEGICEVTVTTAVPMDEALLAKLHDKLVKITGKTVLMNTKVDACILGGVVLNLGNDQIDSSVKTRLNELAQQMTQIIA